MFSIVFKVSADIGEKIAWLCNPVECHPLVSCPSPLLKKCSVFNDFRKVWYWARTRDKASHGPIPIPLGYRGHQTNIGDDYIAEFSDVFREAINARNIYAAWARKLTNSKPSDPDVQLYHQEVKKAGESVESLLVKLNVPLFKIPATEKELDKIVFRVKNKAVEPLPPKNQEAKKPAAVSPPPPPPSNSSRKGRKAAKRSVDADGFAPPPKQLVRKTRSPRSSPPPSLLPRLLSKTRVWKVRKRKWNFRNQRCKIRSWCPR
ncbi:hypothetical protein TNCV_483751 [Trichonephila clavipes]|nr:hypothetical protein TNCV_483751 [Trichonephila clavipes]